VADLPEFRRPDPERFTGRDVDPTRDPPVFAPVIFDEGAGGRPPRGGGPGFDDGDAGLMRVLGLIVVLGVVIVALVLPGSPIRLIGGGSTSSSTQSGIKTTARAAMPAVPEGLVALSKLYDIATPTQLEGPWTLTVPLADRTTDGRNVAFYRYDGARWVRIAGVDIVENGASAQGDVNVIPPNIAVLRRTSVVLALNVSVGSGAVPDAPALAGSKVIAVGGGTAAQSADGKTGTLRMDDHPLDAAVAAAKAAGSAAVYVRIAAPAGDAADAVNRMLGSPDLMQTHVGEIVAAATAAGAGGVQIDYRLVAAAHRAEFSTFVSHLASALQAKQLGLIVSVPTPTAADTGAYDWPALSKVAKLWLYAPDDLDAYYEQVEAALTAQRGAGVDLANVSLVIDRASRDRSRAAVQPITLRDALALASDLQTQPDSGVTPGQAVTLSAVNLDKSAGNSGLHWDDSARAVSFSYSDRLGPHTVWIANAFSLAFRLDLAERFGLGGIAIANAQQDDALPPVWDAVTAFIDDGAIDLQQPYGPYLVPCWKASGGTIDGYGAGCWKAGLTSTGAATWHAPTGPGTYDLSLIVSDGTMFVGQQLSVRVGPTAAPSRPTPTPTPTAAAAH
jgi:hypothetical protein